MRGTWYTPTIPQRTSIKEKIIKSKSSKLSYLIIILHHTKHQTLENGVIQINNDFKQKFSIF